MLFTVSRFQQVAGILLGSKDDAWAMYMSGVSLLQYEMKTTFIMNRVLLWHRQRSHMPLWDPRQPPPCAGISIDLLKGCWWRSIFYNAFILWINEAVVHYTWPLTCGIPRPMRTQASRCGTPSLWLLFWLSSGTLSAPISKGAAQSIQPQVSTDLGYCKFFNVFYNLNCSA
jgi:hypothetical protein